MLSLVESFASIQGEGKFAGRLAVFFRFAGCNLNCAGFNCELKSPKTGEILRGCDTIRAVKTAHFDYEKISTVSQLLDKIGTNFKNSLPIIVITGGEPLLNYANPLFYEFIDEILKRNFEVHFETNGTIFVDFQKFPLYKNCVFAVSVKLGNSKEPREKRLNFTALQNLKNNAKIFFYKFVICKNFDAKSEIYEILENVYGEVWCMPLAKNREQLSQNALYCAKFCLQNGFNYSDRLHIRLWNDKNGV